MHKHARVATELDNTIRIEASASDRRAVNADTLLVNSERFRSKNLNSFKLSRSVVPLYVVLISIFIPETRNMLELVISTKFPLSSDRSRGPITESCNHEFRKIITLLATMIVALLVSVSPMCAQPISRPIPVKLPSRDTLFSQALPQLPSQAAGIHGSLHLDSNGHILANDGTRLRFFGTSLTFTAQFLSSTDARTLAARLKKLGFNAVKFVYNDAFGYDDASFFKANDSTGKASGSSYLVNPAQLAKFDTLQFELKKNGIYAFMMLNSVHSFAKNEGIPHPDSAYTNGYLFELLDPGAAQLERSRARTLLSHVNPLTGFRLRMSHTSQ